MSWLDFHKKKRRSAKKPILIFGEGLGEEMFLKHLRSLYAYNSNVYVTVRKGKGGAPVDVVISASRVLGDFDKKFVLLDNDKPRLEMEKARKKAQGLEIYLLENNPCLEALLLSILHDKRCFDNEKSSWCKREFEIKYIPKKKRSEIDRYKKIFPKAILDRKRKSLTILNQLISLIERGY